MAICIICKLGKDLTEEHIIPEFLGGGLVVRNVCKECNSKMGFGFEGRLSKNFIYKGFRYINAISGKSGVPFPLEGSHTDEFTRTKFVIKRDGSLKSHPSCRIYEVDGRMGIEVSADEDDEDKIPAMLEKCITRYVSDKGRRVNPDKVSALVSDLIAEQGFSREIFSNPQITVSGHVSFDDIELLHIKIAYELACHHYGEAYLSDPVAEELRLSLMEQSIRGGIKIRTPPHLDPFLEYANDKYHWVIFYSGFCYIKICGFSSMLVFASCEINPDILKSVVYRFCYRTGSYLVLDFMGLIRSRLIGDQDNG